MSSRCPCWSTGDQLAPGEPLANQPPHNGRYSLQGCQWSDIVPSSQLSHVAMQVLGRHGVMSALVGTLEDRPGALYSLGVDSTIHVLTFVVRDDVVIGQVVVAA